MTPLHRPTADELKSCGFQYSTWDTWDKHLEHSARVWRYANGRLYTGVPRPMSRQLYGRTFDLDEEFEVTSIEQIKKVLTLYGD